MLLSVQRIYAAEFWEAYSCFLTLLSPQKDRDIERFMVAMIAPILMPNRYW